jgi:hypothetical protein
MDYLFDSSGRVKDVFLKERSRDVLIKGYVLSVALVRIVPITA